MISYWLCYLELNFHAREFLRGLDRLVGEKIFNGGISLGEGKGKLKIELNKEFSEKMKISFVDSKVDHKILAIASYYHNIFPKQKTVLVSKDVNLRIKAKSIGIHAEDYESDKVNDIEGLIKGAQHIDVMDSNIISNLYQSQDGINIAEYNIDLNIEKNHFFILDNGQSSALARYNPFEKRLIKVNKKKVSGIKPRNAEQTFAIEVLLDPKIQLVSMTGKAGTGKTLLALAAALGQRKAYEQILLARPIVSLSNRDIGYLPGDQHQKIEPYMQPLLENLTVIKHQYSKTSKEYKRIGEMVENEELVITPLAYIRGRSLSKTFFIIDEAQNLTPHEVKTIITRAGEGTKMVFTGDVNQIDSPYLDTHSNGLSYFTERMRGQDLFAHVNLMKGERSYLSELASDLL